MTNGGGVMDRATFSNHKSQILNEILQSARSLNDNGFINAEVHLMEALALMKVFFKELKKDG